MKQLPNSSMLSLRPVLIIATHYCTIFLSAALLDSRKFRTRRRGCDHITEVLINLHWLKVEQRIIYKILILTYKSFVDLSAPLYLRDLVKKKNKSANTRLADDSLLLVVPPISKGSSNTFFERSFIYAAPTEWNKLDGRIRKITNFDSFKREINTTLFQITLICNCTI